MVSVSSHTTFKRQSVIPLQRGGGPAVGALVFQLFDDGQIGFVVDDAQNRAQLGHGVYSGRHRDRATSFQTPCCPSGGRAMCPWLATAIAAMTTHSMAAKARS